MLDQIELGRRLGRFDVDFSGGLATCPAMFFWLLKNHEVAVGLFTLTPRGVSHNNGTPKRDCEKMKGEGHIFSKQDFSGKFFFFWKMIHPFLGVDVLKEFPVG